MALNSSTSVSRASICEERSCFSDLAPAPFCSAFDCVVGALFLAGCADTRGGPIPYDKPLAAPDEAKFQTLETNYKIAPMDKLSIKVFKMDDLSGDYDVDLAGNISLPLIGQIAGREPDDRAARRPADAEARRQISRASGRQRRDQVVHRPCRHRRRRGQGRRLIPGRRPDLADPGGRHGQGHERRRQCPPRGGLPDDRRPAPGRGFDLTSIRRGQAPDPQIYPGDIVVVDGSSIKAAQKQIFQSFPLLVDLQAVLERL